MIGQQVSVVLPGILQTAFQTYCIRRGISNGAEGLRTMVRELPEYLALLADPPSLVDPAGPVDPANPSTSEDTNSAATQEALAGKEISNPQSTVG